MHRGALLSDGHIEGKNLICGLRGWDYCYTTGISSSNNEEAQHRFQSWVEDGALWVDEGEIAAWEAKNPQPYDREAYQGLYKDHHGKPEEPHFQYIQHLAEHGLSKLGHHGRVAAMGVPRTELPTWDDIQVLTAQLHKLPLLDDAPVGTDAVIGPNAARPLTLDIPLFVSDMSFGALSEKAKVALAKGAEQLNNFFRAATEFMQVLARACGHHHLNHLSADDLTTWKREMAHLTGIRYGGVSLG
jgi:glutamate synthase domain-containing protein 2